MDTTMILAIVIVLLIGVLGYMWMQHSAEKSELKSKAEIFELLFGACQLQAINGKDSIDTMVYEKAMTDLTKKAGMTNRQAEDMLAHAIRKAGLMKKTQ